MAQVEFTGSNTITIQFANTHVGSTANPFSEFLEGNYFGSTGTPPDALATVGNFFGGEHRDSPYFKYFRSKYKKCRIFGSRISVRIAFTSGNPQLYTVLLLPMTWNDEAAMKTAGGKTYDEWNDYRGCLSKRALNKRDHVYKVGAYASSHAILNVPKHTYTEAEGSEFSIDETLAVGDVTNDNRWRWHMAVGLNAEGTDPTLQIALCQWKITYLCMGFDKTHDYE